MSNPKPHLWQSRGLWYCTVGNWSTLCGARTQFGAFDLYVKSYSE